MKRILSSFLIKIIWTVVFFTCLVNFVRITQKSIIEVNKQEDFKKELSILKDRKEHLMHLENSIGRRDYIIHLARSEGYSKPNEVIVYDLSREDRMTEEEKQIYKDFDYYRYSN